MQYLVKAEFIDPGALFPPQQLAALVENAVIPSFEALIKLMAQKKILAGGLVAGARAGAFIVEAASNDEASRLVHDLPFWGLLKWEVIPLESVEHRMAMDREFVQHLKAMK